jgi:hypothetical protein
MWKYIVERGRPQMTTWRTHVPSRIPKATNIHSEYVLLIDFLLQQWFFFSVKLYGHCLSWWIIKWEWFLCCVVSATENHSTVFERRFCRRTCSSVPTWSVLFVKERRSQNYKCGSNNKVTASEGLRYVYPCRLALSHLRKVFQPICYSPYRRAGFTIYSCTRERRVSNFDGLSDKQIDVCLVVWLNHFSQMRDSTLTYG